jgi:methylenetetrahydrofolate--tRNA-(uracil-5-)-methyltransferase
MNTQQKVHIVGAGLAGSEAAWFLANRGVEVHIHEMRPVQMTEAHKTDRCAELVCSNSLKSKVPHSAPGIMKAEMRRVGSLILEAASKSEVPGGDALTVDRDIFSEYITAKLTSLPNIHWHKGVVTKPFEDGITLLATGPLTAEGLTDWLVRATGEKDLYFYDAIAPIIDAQSINWDKVFIQNRYDKGGEEAYVNCPMTKDQYYAFVDALIAGEKVPPKPFEKEKFFQGCQPIEAIADTGRETLRFGPMKPVGLNNPLSSEKPYAVIQLRPENQAKTAYNMVGFQTKLKWGPQGKIFRTIPGLENAEFLRMGSIHRNTYVCGPRVLRGDLSLRGYPKVYMAGQVTGVEGYLESTACGMMAAHFILQRLEGRAHEAPPANTAMGSLLRYITGSNPDHYQPGNIHFGLFDPALYEGAEGLKKDPLRELIADQSVKYFNRWWDSVPKSAIL